MVREVRNATQELRKDSSSGQTKVRRSSKSPERVLELLAPESTDRSGAHHHEHLTGLGQQLQDLVDELGKIVGNRNRGVVLAERRVPQIPLVD